MINTYVRFKYAGKTYTMLGTCDTPEVSKDQLIDSIVSVDISLANGELIRITRDQIIDAWTESPFGIQ